MKAAIDRAGRVIIPKPLRDELGLQPGQQLEVSLRDGRIEIEPVATEMRLEERGEVLVAIPDVALPPLTTREVRRALERTRR